MSTRLPLFAVLLLLASLLLTAGTAHSAPAVPAAGLLAFEEPFEAEAETEEEGEEAATDCDTAYEEADEGELGYDEAEEVCVEEDDEARAAANPHRGKPKAGKPRHRTHGHKKKSCRRHRAAGGKRHCPRRSRGR